MKKELYRVVYEEWLNNENVSDRLKQDMEKMDEKTIKVAFQPGLIKFGTSGYRAEMGPGCTFLNVFTYTQLAYGYGKYIQTQKNWENRPVILARDNRLNSDKYVLLIADVLSSMGINVYIIKDNVVLSTPHLSYLIIKLNAVGGINITASHNPKKDNGFKTYNSFGSQLLPDEDKILVESMLGWDEVLNYKVKPDTSKIHTLKDKDVQSFFTEIQKISDVSKAAKKTKVLFSSMHGAATPYMVKFLRKLGYDAHDFEKQNFISSSFENAKIINPEEPEAFDPAIKYANENDFELIFAADPDADRLGIAYKHNDKWEFLTGNEAGIIQTYYLLEKNKNIDKNLKIISTYVSNNMIDRLAKEYNAEVIRTTTGFKWIANAMNQLSENDKFITGFEEAIGATTSDLNREKDSFQVAATLLEIYTKFQDKKYTFKDILEKEIFPKYGTWFGKTQYFMIPGYDWKLRAQELMKYLLNYKHKNILNREIIKIEKNDVGQTVEFNFKNDSWLKFRISGTEPKFKMYFNLFTNEETETTFEELKHEALEIIEYLREELGL